MANASIGQASGEQLLSHNSDVWNISDGFMKIKVLRLLIELDLQETMAMFGRQSMEEDVPDYLIPQRRVEGLNRMIFVLRQLIGNVKFTIEQKDKPNVSNLISRIETVEKYINGISRIVVNDVTKQQQLVINEDHFNTCFTILRHIKDELNVPINKAGLIFKKGNDIDLDSLMRDIMEGN